MTSVTPAIAHNHLRAEYIADILWHIYGDASETLLDGVQATFSKSFEQSSALIFKAARRRTAVRDGDGDGFVFDGTPQERPAKPSESSTLFKRKNSDARVAEIHASIEKALAGDRTSKSANELTDMLSELTVKELREIKTKYGMKASGRTKAEFVAKIATRLDSGRRADHSVGPGIKLSSEDKYWLQPLLRVHTENRRPDDEQRMMVEAVVSGKPLTPVQKTQAIELFQRKYNELNSTLGVGGNRQGQNQSKAVESVLTKLGVNARQEWKNSAGAINRFPQVPSPVNPEPQRIAPEQLPTREEVRASLPPARSAADRAARARAEVMAARASQSDKPIVAPMPVVAKPVSAPVATQYSADQIMQREVLNRAERALRLTKKGRWSGPEITQEDVDRLNARFPNAAPRDAIAKALFSRAMMLKADIRDADGDGMIYDGTPQERPSTNYGDRLAKMRERRGENSQGVSMAVTETPEFKEWFGDSKVVDANGNPLVVYHGTSSVQDFNEFSVSGLGRNETSSLGAWFADDSRVADSFSSISTLTWGYYPGVKDDTAYDLSIDGGYGFVAGEPVNGETEVVLESERSRTIPAFLSIRNPKVYKIGDGDDPFVEMMNDRDEFVQYIDGTYGQRGYWKKGKASMHNSDVYSRKFVEHLVSLGYDGIVLSGTRYDSPDASNGVTTNQYIVFSPNQIKSAIGNSGKFSRDSSDIRKSVSSAIFTRAASEKDGDGDGLTADGTPQERAVSKQPVQEKPKNSEKTEENVDSLKARIIRMRDSLLRLPAGKRPKNNIEILNKAGRELFERTGEKLTKDGWVKTQEKTIAKKEQTTDPRFRHASPQAKQDGKKFVVDHEGIKTESASRDTAEADWAHEYEIQNGRRWEPSRQKKDSIQKPPVNKSPEKADRNVAPLPQRDDRLRTRDKVTDAIVGTLFGVKKDIEGINNAVKPREGVTPEQAQAYKDVLNDALKQMPPGMIDNIGKNLKSVEIHKDMWSITKEVHERDGEEYNGKSITFGFFDPRSGSVHLDGNLPEGVALKSGGEFSQRGLYAHELAHAADKLEDGTYFSKSKAWADSYASEINTDATPLSKYARVSPSEGFAEFVRYATENPEEARKNFPKSMKSVESRYGRM